MLVVFCFLLIQHLFLRFLFLPILSVLSRDACRAASSSAVARAGAGSPYVVLRLLSRCLCFVPPWAEPFPCVLYRARRRRGVIAGGERSLELGSTTCTGKENIRAHVRVRTPGVVCSERNLLLTSKAISK